MFLIDLLLEEIVLCPKSNHAHSSLEVRWGDWVLSNKKLTIPKACIMPAAHVFVCPDRRGDGRLRASLAASATLKLKYSSLSFSLQKVDRILHMSPKGFLTLSGTFGSLVFCMV